MKNYKLFKFLAVTFFGLCLLTANSFAAEEHRPFSEMQGDCDNFKSSLKNEFLIWDLKEQNIVSAKDDKNTPSLSAGEKARLALDSESEVKLVLNPEKKFPSKEKKYAGMVKILTTQKGTYRISIGSKVWADLINQESKKAQDALRFEMQTSCNKIFKTIEFSLEKNQEYILQVSSSKSPFVDVLFTPVN